MSAARWFGDSTIRPRFPAWTRGNAADVFPDPFSPLGQSMVIRGAMCLGLRDAYISLGVLDWEEFDEPAHPDLFHMFGGYLYNPLSLTRLLGARMPGASPEAIDQAFFDDRADVPVYVAEPWHESAVHEARLGETVAWALSVEALPYLDADKELAESLRDRRPDLTALTDAALIARAKAMKAYVQQTFESAMRTSSLVSVGPGALAAICAGIGRPELSIELLAGIEVDSAAPSHAMWALSRTARASAALTSAYEAGVDDLLDRLATTGTQEATAHHADLVEFLRTYGSRGQNEYDLLAHTWEVRPRIALAAIDLMRRSGDDQAPSVRHAASIARRDAALAEIRGLVAADPETAGLFEAALRSSGLFLSGRERAKTNAIMVIGEMRMALRELGRRLVERGVLADVDHLFMLTEAEVEHLRLDPAPLRDVVVERWTTFRSLFDREPLFAVIGVEPTIHQMAVRSERTVEQAASGAVLRGAAGSGGVATGRARVVLDAADPLGLEPGDVLIAPQTDPSWVPLLVAASAAVVNVGAMGSHAMIVSRELGIPCVVSVADATLVIPDGATVTVDGTAGTVTVH